MSVIQLDIGLRTFFLKLSWRTYKN